MGGSDKKGKNEAIVQPLPNQPEKGVKAVIFVGAKSHLHPTYFNKTFAKKGFTENSDFLVVGTGKRKGDVPEEYLRKKLEGKIGPDTAFFLYMHGTNDIAFKNGTSFGEHSVTFLKEEDENDFETGKTEYLVDTVQDMAGNQPVRFHVLACDAGASQDCIDVLQPGSFIVSYTSDKGSTNEKRDQQIIIKTVTNHINDAKKANFNAKTFMLSHFIENLSNELDDVNISYKIDDRTATHFTSKTSQEFKRPFQFRDHKNSEIQRFVRDFVPSVLGGNPDHSLRTNPELGKVPTISGVVDRVNFGISHDLPDYTERYAKNLKLMTDFVSLLPLFDVVMPPFVLNRIKNYPHDVHSIDAKGLNIVKSATAAGSFKVLKQHLHYNPIELQYLNTPHKDGKTLLHIAIENAFMKGDGHFKVVELLLSKNADPNIQDINGATPLHLAVNYGKPEIAKLLLANKAIDPNIQDKNGATPLHWTVIKRQPKITKLLLANQAIDPNIQDKNGATPLHWAVMNGQLEIAKLLLANQANPNIQDKNGATPLHWAQISNQPEIAQLLLANRANPDIGDKNGLTPMQITPRNTDKENTVIKDVVIKVENNTSISPWEKQAVNEQIIAGICTTPGLSAGRNATSMLRHKNYDQIIETVTNEVVKNIHIAKEARQTIAQQIIAEIYAAPTIATGRDTSATQGNRAVIYQNERSGNIHRADNWRTAIKERVSHASKQKEETSHTR